MSFRSLRNCTFSILIAVAALAFLAPASMVQAGRPPKTTKPKTPVKHETVISSVTATAITVSQDNQTKTYQISAFTEVTLNGQRATVADLKPGMVVSVVLTDPTRVSRITAMSK